MDPDSPGPLAEFLGWDDQRRGNEETSEADRQEHYETQEFIADCMRQAGFEYHPKPFWADRPAGEAGSDQDEEEAWRLREDDPRTFAGEYGYGISTINRSNVEHTPDAADDPNAHYRESLSPAAQREYDNALWGNFEEIASEHAGEQSFALEPTEMGGCMADAWEHVLGIGNEESNPRFEDLWREWDALTLRIDSDPRMQETVRVWSSCMADAGYADLNDLDGGRGLVHERRNNLRERVDESPNPPAVDDAESSSDADGAETTTPPELEEPDLAELQEFELAIAWADFTCRQDHDVDRIEREVRFAHEQTFVDEHRAELEAYRDWVNEQGASG